MKITKKVFMSNLVWRFLERVGAQGVNLLVEIILARILFPEDYGLIALVTVFITVLNVFVNSGFGNALIQKKAPDDLDYSSVFWFNIVWCVFLYLVLFFIAPFIGQFYQKPEIVPILRVLGIQIIISGIKNVQQAYVSNTMQFRRFFFATLGGTLGAAAIGIWMAYHNYGVWALVAQHLFNTIVDTMILWITVKWRPKFQFSFSRLKALYSYGWKLLVSTLIDTFYNELRQLIIGKYYSSADLAQYNRGRQFPFLFITNVNSAIDSVLLPTMSREQDSQERVKALTRRAILTSTYIITPLMIGLAAIGDPLVEVLLTKKWLPCVPFMRIFCITFILYPIHTANLNAIKAMGRSDLFLKLEIIKKIIGIIALIISMGISVKAMAYSLLISSIISQIINAWPNRKLLDYKYFDQIKDVFPAFLLSSIMGLVVYSVSFIKLQNILIVLIQIFLGAFIYIMGSKCMHLESYQYITQILFGKRNNGNDKGISD